MAYKARQHGLNTLVSYKQIHCVKVDPDVATINFENQDDNNVIKQNNNHKGSLQCTHTSDNVRS